MRTVAWTLAWVLAGVLTLLLLLGWVVPTHSGGPRAVDGLGQPLKWNSALITYNPDPGPLGTLTGTEARTLLNQAFQRWSLVGFHTFTEGTPLPGDVNGQAIPFSNPDHFLHYWRKEGDGRSPVIFDQDGSVIDGLFGQGARFDILGVAALDTPLGHCSGGISHGAACIADAECTGGTCAPSTDITGASLVINGLFHDGVGLPGSPPDLSSAELEGVMVHEIGHLLNLDHSVVNHELAGDGNPANDIYLPTMYPLLVDAEAELATPNLDDILALTAIYNPVPPTTGISGVIRTASGVPFQGANVVLRRMSKGPPLLNSYSVVSGGRFFPCNPGSTCDPCETTCDPGNPAAQGAYSVPFLPMGSYRVCVEQIDTRFTLDNGIPIGPLATPVLLPGPEECYDVSESGTVLDDPDDGSNVFASLTTGIDIRFNPLAGPTEDPFEPNNSLGSPAVLADLGSGQDTAAAYLGAGDLDVYALPISAPKRVRVDVDAAELGSTLDAAVAIYDQTNTLVAFSDDSLDPQSGAFTVDPALDVTLIAAGVTYKIVVSSYPDLDFNGSGGTTTGGYWIRVRFDGDSDADGIVDATDNCIGTSNVSQVDFDEDGFGDVCDTDDDGDGLTDLVETNTGVFLGDGNTGSNPLDPDSDDDGVNDGAEAAEGVDPNTALAAPDAFSAGQLMTATPADGAASVFAADMDGDGDLDVLAASYLDDTIAWYETEPDTPSWIRRVITSTANNAWSVFAADVDGDGDTDALSASFLDDTIAWYENDGATPPGFTPRTISTAADSAVSVFAADVDGDGDMDALSASFNDDKIVWYENNGATPPGWNPRNISTTADGANAVYAADLDGDGDTDALSAAYLGDKIVWYENNGASPPAWTERLISAVVDAATSVFAADVDGDGDTDVLSASDFNPVVWYESNGASPPAWTPRTISVSASGPKSVFATDLDADGDMDVLSASEFDNKIAWFEQVGISSIAWSARTITTAAESANSVFAADLDGDGDKEILSASINDDKVAWYENRSIHRSATFPAASTLSAAADGALSVFAGDVDGDGDVDALSASHLDDTVAWYENNGASPPGWTERTISTAADAASSVFAADVDGDGHMDALSTSFDDDTIAWYESNGATPPSWTERTISTAADGAASVVAADVDGDGDMDALAAAYLEDTVAWYENNGASPPGWTERTISTAAVGPYAVFAADVDGDGHMDVLSASFDDDTIAWYENNGASPPDLGWTERTISTTADGADAVHAADVDGDGDMDALSASFDDDTIAWYENNGASPPGWTERTISTAADGASSVSAADVDGDGDTDVISTSVEDDKVVWYENDGVTPPHWIAHTISTEADGVWGGFAKDVDGDHDVDVLAARSNDNQVTWYENRGGPYAFSTQVVAPPTVQDGHLAALLRTDLVHRGRAGDAPIRLSAVSLRLERSPGVSISSAQLDALLSGLLVHVDDGSGVFESASDAIVGQVSSFSDETRIDLQDPTDTRLHVAAGTAKSFFVVAALEANASSQNPNQFMATQILSGGSGIGASRAENVATRFTLDPEFSPDVSTPVVTVTENDVVPPTVTAVFPPNGSVDVALSTSVVLSLSEPVDPSTATPDSVSLSVGGLKIAGTVALSADGTILTFDPVGLLAVDTNYVLAVTSDLRDFAAIPATPFSATFNTANAAGGGQIEPVDVGGPADEEVSGAVLDGADADDHFGFAVAAVGDVNQDGVADLVVGAPNANVGANVDAGKVRLIFGGPALQSDATNALELAWVGSAAQQFAGETVARAGDLDDDGIADFAIGAPRSDLGGTDAGLVYVVFGDAGLDELAPGPIALGQIVTSGRGVVLVGDFPGDLAGSAVAYAGDLNGDGNDDLLVGAPGASPLGRTGAGKVYLLYGPLVPATIDLGTVGTTTPGLVFYGETALDAAGLAVSGWEDNTGPDDLLIGAPEATVLDEFGAPLDAAGYVYAIHGGPANLQAKATPGGVIELSRVANGLADQVDGVVFLGAIEDGNIGRSISGSADLDGDGVADVLVGGHDEAWLIPGDDPKTTSGASTLDQRPRPTGTGLARQMGAGNATGQFGATVFHPGTDGTLGDLTVGPAGDVNLDGNADFIIGAPAADPGGRTNAGTAYLVYGSETPFAEEVLLSDVGSTVPGLAVDGAEGVNGAEPGDQLGAAVGGGFDVTGDGVADALIGAPFADALGAIPNDAGQAYVISPVASGEVSGLLLGKSGGTVVLEWQKPHRALVYNVYRGLLSTVQAAGQVRTSAMAQLRCEISTDADSDGRPDTTDAALPAGGAVFLYLVTAENLTGEGPLGPPGATPPRLLDAHCP